MTENYSTQNTLDMLAKMLADPSNVTDDATDTTPNVDGKRPQGLGRPSLGKREPISGPLQQISYAMGMFNPKLDKGNVPKKVDLDAEGFMTKLQANWDRLVPFKLRGEQLATDAPYKARGNTTFSQEPMTNADASPLLSGTGVSSNDMPPLRADEKAKVAEALAVQSAMSANKDVAPNEPAADKPRGLMSRGTEQAKWANTSNESDGGDIVSEGVLERKMENRIIGLEGIETKAYKPIADEEHWTIGIGDYGSHVREGQIITEEEALKRFREVTLPAKVKLAKKLFKNYDSISEDLKTELVQGIFRGDFKSSHNSVKLINKGKYAEAAVEFLDNSDYRKALADPAKLGGVATRMEAVRDALLAEAE
tara:strand:+ start:2165 stop:3262 length:1098 start_codon:yes stop_codon:yes gene_type:complete